MATIKFFAGDSNTIGARELPAGSGLGFYGPNGFGSSVAVNTFQDDTYITDANGTTNNGKANNIKYINTSGGSVHGSAYQHLRTIPNGQATLNVRFEHTSSVKTQNVKLRIYDRSNIANPASGVTTKVAELIHPSTDETDISLGSGSALWETPAGAASIMSLISSPGTSGERPDGSNTSDTRHDWYLALSASPDSIGSKNQYALWIELEYL